MNSKFLVNKKSIGEERERLKDFGWFLSDIIGEDGDIILNIISRSRIKLKHVCVDIFGPRVRDAFFFDAYDSPWDLFNDAVSAGIAFIFSDSLSNSFISKIVSDYGREFWEEELNAARKLHRE